MNMKFIKTIFTIISIIMTFCLCSCQNEAFSNADALTVSDSTAVLTLNIDNGAGRSAAPDIDFSDLIRIELSVINPDVSDDYGRIIGEWRTIEELNAAKINIPVGRYTFTMWCDTAGVLFSDQKTVAVTAGANALTFRPRRAFADTMTGRGNLNVTITYPTDGIAAVTGGLYTLDGENAGSSYIDEDLTTDLTTDGGCSTYSKTGVYCGEYLVVFRFYGDAEKTLLRGIYHEYCWLTNGKTSSSNCSISSVAGLFNIEYELNGGTFAGGSTVPGSYTRFSDTVTLPTADTITKAGSTFGGWYDNEGLTGEPVTQIPSGSIGDKTYYAKWIENAAVTFDKNDAGATITTSTQSVQRGVETNLLTAAVLGLANNGKRFFGWAETSDGAVKYYDGDAVTLTEDKTLYAIWSATAINPSDESDTTDTDGDGLPDWEELHTYFTDPSNPDTDGDGWSDGDEIEMRKQNANAFSPLIADAPAIEVMLADEPIIEYVYQLANGQTGSQSTVKYFGAGTIGGSGKILPTNLKDVLNMLFFIGYTPDTKWVNIKAYNEMHNWGKNYGRLGAWGIDGEGYEINQQTMYNGSIANGDCYIHAVTETVVPAKSWLDDDISVLTREGKNVIGGKLKFKYKFRNPGNTTYGVNKATVTLKTIPLGTVDASEIASITKLFIGQINSKQESQVYETECQLSTQMLDQVMKRSAGFTLEVSGYETSLVNSIGSDYKTYNEVLSRVKSQTAALFIDYGYASGYRGNGYCFGYGVTYNVAAKNQFNKDSTTVDDMYFQNNLEYVFNTILDMSGDYELSDEGYIKSINGVANAADIKDGAWYIGHKYTENGKRMLKTYSPYTGGDDKTHWSLSNIKISAGDEISIIYAKDADNDGVPLNEEIMYGTDDTKSDTDGDGLSDYEEIYGWYKDGIGLDAKYSDSNKVYTNPKLADTDGDGLSDYSADSTKQDSDPINSERADDTRLRCRYAQTLSGSLTDFSFGDDDTYTIDNIGDKIYLDITPIQLSAATVQYKLGNDGEYKTLGKTDKISLNLGENKIYIRCTAPDHTTYKDYVLTVNSNFNKMKDFKAEAPKYNFDADWNEPHIFSCALVYLNWSTYDDERACVPDGGYVLYAKKESSVRNNVSLPRDFETSGLLAGIEDLVFERYVNYKDEFYVKLSSDDLFKGAYPKEIDLRQNTNYSFYLFAYTGADSESAYRYELLGSANVKTGKSRYAELNIYGHYFYDKEDHDGTYDPDYYWGFCNPKSAYESLPQGAERVPYIPSIPDVLNFSAFNHCDLVLSHGLYTGLKRDSIEFDDDDDKSYCFGEGKIHKYGDDPKKFSNCTKVVSTIFDRTQNYSFTETFEAWEIDFWESDYLGKVTANFTYTSATDTWTCSWSSTTGQKAGSAISAGQRTGKTNGSKDDGLRWELHNTDYGEVEFHWDWGWDE